MGKITQQPPDTAPTNTDYITVVDSETGLNKKVLLSDLLTLINASGSALATNFNNPYKFFVYLNTGTLNVAPNGIIIFDTKLYDTSSNYNTGTGIFTAPVAGFYELSGALQVTGGSSFVMGIEFAKNGARYIRGGEVPATGSANYTIPIAPPPIQLAVNDTIAVTLQTTNSGTSGVNGAVGPVVTYFGGFLVSKT